MLETTPRAGVVSPLHILPNPHNVLSGSPETCFSRLQRTFSTMSALSAVSHQHACYQVITLPFSFSLNVDSHSDITHHSCRQSRSDNLDLSPPQPGLAYQNNIVMLMHSSLRLLHETLWSSRNGLTHKRTPILVERKEQVSTRVEYIYGKGTI